MVEYKVYGGHGLRIAVGEYKMRNLINISSILILILLLISNTVSAETFENNITITTMDITPAAVGPIDILQGAVYPYPNTFEPGQTITFVYSINNPTGYTLYNYVLGAQIRTNPSGTWRDDNINDPNPPEPITPGTKNYARIFIIGNDGNPVPTAPGPVGLLYDVRWVVYDKNTNIRSDELTYSSLVRMVPKISANAGGTKTGYVNEWISFSPPEATGGYPPLTYSWDFGDGTPAQTGQTTSHKYTSARTYDITLTVTDNLDGEAQHKGTAYTTATVTARPPIIADAYGPYSDKVNVPVSFYSSATGGTGSYSYIWDFGDGSTGSGQNPTHSYASAGTYTVYLTVTDSAGNIGQDTATVYVDPPIIAEAYGPYSGNVNVPISFSGSAIGGTGSYSSYSWNFEEGSTGSGQNPSHTYTSEGIKYVTLTVTDSSGHTGQDTATVTVGAVVNQPPYQPTLLNQFRSDGTTPIAIGTATNEKTVIFKGRVSDPDGDKVKLQIELRRLDEYGGNFDETKGGLKESDLVVSGSTVTTYAIDLIDGSYHWRARTIDEHGKASDWIEFGGNPIVSPDFIISINQPPIASFTYSPINAIAGEQIVFDASSSSDSDGKIVLYEWDWDSDGNYDENTIDPTIIFWFNEANYYIIKLRVTDDKGVSSVTIKTVNILMSSSSKTNAILVGWFGGITGLQKWYNPLWVWQNHKDFTKIDLWLREGRFNGKWQVNPVSQPLDWLKDDHRFSLLNDNDIIYILNKEIDHNTAPSFTYKDYAQTALYEEDLVNNIFKVSEAWQGSGVVGARILTKNLIPNIADVSIDIAEELIPMLWPEFPPAYIYGIYTIIQAKKVADIKDIFENLGDTYYAGALRAYFYNRGNGCVYQTDQQCIDSAWQSAENVLSISFAGTGISDTEKSIFLEKTKPYFEALWQEYKDKGTYGIGLADNYRIDAKDQVRKKLISGLEKYKNELPNREKIDLASPGELRIFDSKGNSTGLINGEIKEEIPNSIYDSEEKTVVIFNSLDTYRYEVVGTDTGTYGLYIISIKKSEPHSITFTEIPTSLNETHQYTANWNNLSNVENVTVKIDSDGDGNFETSNTIHLPYASFEYLPIKVVANQNVTFNSSSSYDPDGNIISYNWDFGDGTNASGEVVNHIYPSEGVYLVTIAVKDDTGAVDKKTIKIIIDATPPATTAMLLGAIGNNGWYISDVQINLMATENDGGSGINKTEYSFDNETWITYTAPFNIISEGTTTFYYRTTDNLGNVESTKNRTIQIDKTSPSSIINPQSVADPTYINLTWTNPPDPDFSHVMLYLNGTFKTNITAPQNYYNFTGLTSDTSYELGTHTVDSSGNFNQTWLNVTARTAPDTTTPTTGPVHNINKGTNYTKIQAAIDDASTGDEIHVDSGIYPENVNVNKRLTLRGIGMPVVDAGGSGNAITLAADGIILEGFTATGRSTEAGIKVTSSGNSLIGNNASDNNLGIYLSSSSNNKLSANNASKNNYGILLQSSSSNMLIRNNASNNNNGISLYSSSNNTLSGNNATSNSNYGIDLRYSSNNTLTNNIMNGNKYDFQLYGDSNSDFDNQIDETNLEDGKTIYYLKGAKDTFYDSSTNAGTFYCISCVNVTLKNVDLKNIFFWNTTNSKIQNVNASNNAGNGIYLAFSNNNTLIGNYANSNTGEGIYLSSSSNNTISGNNASNNAGNGIVLDSSGNNTLSGNNASNNTGSGIDLFSSSKNKVNGNNAYSNNNGIHLQSSSNNMVIDNNVSINKYNSIYLHTSNNNTLNHNNANSNNYIGIIIAYSDNNTMSGNNASNNNIGVYLTSSSYNLIYNNIFNNTNNVEYLDSVIYTWNITRQSGTNIVGSPFLGGNFWAKPDGTGFSQTCTDVDGDGICDSAYVIDSNNIDYLPLAGNDDPGTKIYSCTKISSPGKYVLTQSIINSGVTNCINITSSDVIFDGAGYTIDGNGLTNYGLYVNNVNHITVRNLVVQDWNTRAVNIVNSNNDYFENITIKSGNYDGFSLQNSNNNILRNIKALNTGNVGFVFENSYGNDLKDSVFQNNAWEDFDIYLTGGVSGCNNKVGNVSLTKYQLYYYNESVNLKDINAGAIYLCNADNSTVTNTTVSANGQNSISNYYVENVTYTNITTSGLQEAIFFKYSANNNITNILMKDGWSGISYSTNTTNTNYKNATIYNMTDRAVRIYAGASRNTISDSKIYNNSVGIYLNTAGKYGPNKIYNTYLNNIKNIEWGIPDFFGDGTVYPNYWNTTKQPGTNIMGGPNLGGNFWGYPNGTGPSQTCTDAGGDGICDLAYTLKSNNIDYLPLSLPSIPSITVISPNGGEDWTQGSTQVIRWNYKVSPGPNVMIELLKNGVLNRVLTSSTSTGSSGSGSYDWQIDPALTPDSDYKIRITSTADPAYTDTSDNNFAISEPSFNLIKNGGFESGKNNWTFYSNVAGSFNIVSPGYEGNNASMIKLDSIGTNMQFFQYPVPIEPNTRYRLSFMAYSTYGDDVVVKLIKHAGSTPYAPDFPADLGTNWQRFSTEFISSGSAMNDARLMFWFVNVGARAGEAYYIDDVRLEKVSSPISECTTISSPGKYVLTQNILNSNVESCINIISSDVIFDGAGYTIDGNGLTNYGLSVKNVNRVTVKNLVVQDWNTRSVNIVNSNNNNFSNITVKSGSFDGFYLQNSNNNILRNITVLDTGNVGFTFDSSQGNDLKDAMFQNNAWEDFDIYLNGGVSGCNNEVRNVALTKYPLYYYNKSVNLKDIYAGAIYLCNADNSTITNATVAANGQSSISNYYVENVTYTNITTSGLKEAIFFKYSENNNITNILMKDGWSGISYSTNTTNTNYKNATIYNMTGRAIRIYAGASRNTISDSKIYNSSVGIYLNTAGKYGPNKIYNSFFNNTQNIEWGIADFFGDGSLYPNYWNTTKQPGMNIMGGPNIGGNFWAYPNGTGFGQTCTDADSDGICDLTYTLKSNNIDYLPLSYNTTTPTNGPVHNINKGINYTKIQAAINDANPGNEIHVDSGSYYENVNVNKQLILRGIGMPVVDAMGSGSAIMFSSDGITLEGFTATNASTGISGSFSGSNIKDNQIISNYGSGIGVLGGYNTISGNHIISNYGDGISISGTENTIKNNEIRSNANGIGLDISNNSVIGNNITYNGDGIYLVYDSKKMNISGNNIDFNSNGIHFPGDNHESLVENNYIRWNTETGISIDGYESGHWNTIYNNYFNNNINTFIYGNNYGFVNYWNITKTSGTNIIGGPNLGGNFWAHPNGTGFSQTCTDADGDGICNSAYVLDSNNIDYLPIAYNAAVRPVHNINKGTNYITIQAAINDANPGDEIHVDNGTYYENIKVNRSVRLIGAGADATIVQAANANDHVFSVSVNSVNITGFKIMGATSDQNAGIYLNSSSNNNLTGNNVSNNSIGIYLYGSIDNNLIGNIVNSNSGYGIYLLDGSTNNNFDDNIVSSNGGTGIFLSWQGSGGYLINNTVSSNGGGGIFLLEAWGDLYNNTVSSNGEGGIYMYEGGVGNIIGNNISSNGGDGISDRSYSVDSNYNNNIINSNGGIGIVLSSPSGGKKITNNTLSLNAVAGIYLQYAGQGNIIYNNFFNNIINLQYSEMVFNNADWNITKIPGTNIVGGPYLGGNFWAHPNGTGFSQTCTDADGDGICDSAFVIDGNNTDYLPLAYNATPDFTISASPLSQSIVQGSSTTYSISLTSLNGFNGAVSLSASGLPAGATASFSPGSITPTGTSTLDIQTLASTPNGSYPFTINGTGGGKTHNVTVTLVVSSQAGNIMVTTNNPGATFTITGPATYSGSGTSWSQSNAPVGTYSIAFGSISGFNTPSDTSETLSNGGTITFSGIYTTIPPQGSNWSMDILANSTDTFGNLLNSKVNFGVNIIATDGYDGAPFDINAAPVSPTGFDLRFSEPGVSTGELKNDTKAPGTSKNWTLLAQAPKSSKINVTWVSGNIPPLLVMQIQELDPNTGLPIGSPIDMKSVNSINFTAGAFSNMQKGYIITASSQISHTISLSRGWNMISLPVNVSNPSIGAIFGSNVTTVYGWTGTSYELSSILELRRGYWALSSSNYDVTVTGTPVVDRDITLTRGWNMVGPVTNGVMVSSLPNVTTVYGWTGTSYTIVSGSDTLTLTKGYWMLANAASTIQV